MKFITSLLIVLIFLNFSEQSRIAFKSINIRHMKKNDVGLIFDALLINDGSSPKETLNFEVRSQKCCLLIDDFYDCETQNIYGVKVPKLEPDKEAMVTLLWPTIIPYNRVGNCTIEILTKRQSGTHVDDIKLIHFNTTIDVNGFPDYMLIYFNDMKKDHGYTKCDYEDLNPFDKCKPVNCELKYFGKRNFFQYPNCIPVTECENDPEVIYDFDTNTCRNLRNFLSNDNIRQIEEGKFTNFIENENFEEKTSTMIDGKTKILKRVRRSMNESQTFADMLLSTAFFIIKIVSILNRN
ncbi:hypothetical protein PVAND_013606 [Polypedilum vanderplanki]|uniref:Uncharacterized protein n=1 Tax=Polypedilum vanderplanki TaxID=319348 RepID=A0A9J6CS36_POLVA|nr:hypothetical protein PVAND_013606 [Polypedilum vanderplanki]